MGWLQAKKRRWPREAPTFAQTVAIVRAVLQAQRDPQGADVLEETKRQHLRLGFLYENAQIHAALRALTDRARPSSRGSKRSGRSR